MGKQLVLVSHGLFCEELKKSTEMIMGPQESIHTVSLLPAESAEDFRAKFEAVIADDFRRAIDRTIRRNEYADGD